jgi:hypothetical protein
MRDIDTAAPLVSCVAGDRGRRYRDCARLDKDTAAPLVSCVPRDGARRESNRATGDANTAAATLGASVATPTIVRFSPSRDVEPDQLHDVQPAQVDVQHTATT